MKGVSYLFLACFLQAFSCSETDATSVNDAATDEAIANAEAAEGVAATEAAAVEETKDEAAVEAAAVKEVEAEEAAEDGVVEESKEEPVDLGGGSSDVASEQKVSASEITAESEPVAEEKATEKPAKKEGFFSKILKFFSGSKK